MKDSKGTEVIFVVYRRRKLADGRWFRVATFRQEGNARKFLCDTADPMLFMEMGVATAKDLSLARD